MKTRIFILVILLEPRLFGFDAFMEPISSIFASIPGDGLLDPDLEGGDGIPVKLDVGFVGIDRVALIVAMPVGDTSDEGFGLAQFPQDDLLPSARNIEKCV